MPTLMMVLGALLAAAAAPPKAPPTSVTLQHCLVSLIHEAQVPAKEAGVLMEFKVKEGDQVSAGDLLARVDDVEAKLAADAAEAELNVAKEEAASDVNRRFSEASARVAKAEYESALDANEKVRGTVPPAEVRRLLLTWHRTALEIEKAMMDQRIAGLKRDVAQAKLATATQKVENRQIKSPLSGMVVERPRHVGEWVQPGDQVLHVVQLDRLRIEGFLKAGEVEPGDVANRPIAVTVQLARGKEAFPGNVVFVSPLVKTTSGEYRVWAEVVNRRENDRPDGQWLLRPGLKAEMTIQLK